MNFDFYEEFQYFSNTELLKIIRQPEQYDPQAVIAANKVIAERDVTEEEKDVVDDHINQQVAKHEKKQLANKQLQIFFQSFVQPDPGSYEVYLNGMLLLLVISSFYQLFLIYGPGGTIYLCTDCSDRVLIMGFVLPAGMLLIAYLLFSRQRWGWLLSFGWFITVVAFYVICYILNATSFMRFFVPWLEFVIGTTLYSGAIYVLNKPQMKEAFGITSAMILKTAIAGLVIAIVCVVLVNFLWT